MQIHEIFAPKNEGILKGLATLAAGMPEKYARQTLGMGDTPYYTKGGSSTAQNPFVGKEEEIRKLMGPLNTGLAQQQFKNWNAALAHYGVDNPTQLDVKTQQALKASVMKNANKTFKVYNLLDFSRDVDPAYRQNAELAQKNIAEIIDNLMNKPGQATQQDWNNFVTNAQEASVLVRMHSNSGNAARALMNAVTRLTQASRQYQEQLSQKAPEQVTQQDKQHQVQIAHNTAELANQLIATGLEGMVPKEDMQQMVLNLEGGGDPRHLQIIDKIQKALAKAKAKGTY